MLLLCIYIGIEELINKWMMMGGRVITVGLEFPREKASMTHVVEELKTSLCVKY